MWASRWLAFQRRAAKDFPDLDLNLPVPKDSEAKKPFSESEVDPKVLSDAPCFDDCPGNPDAPTEGSSPSWPAGASFSVHSPTPDI